MILLVFVVIIVGVVIVFSVQNAAPVVVSFISWQFNASLAVVVFLSAVCGMCIMALIFGSLRLKKSVRRKAPVGEVKAAAPGSATGPVGSHTPKEPRG